MQDSTVPITTNLKGIIRGAWWDYDSPADAESIFFILLEYLSIYIKLLARLDLQVALLSTQNII